MTITDRVAGIAAMAGEWRRDLHAHPELLYELPRTGSLVEDRLRAFGCDRVEGGVGGAGVVGTIEGPGDRVIGIRADMDALPIEEVTGLPHASTDAGRMHACGHDGNNVILLGTARHLAETRDFAGRVALIFQIVAALQSVVARSIDPTSRRS